MPFESILIGLNVFLSQVDTFEAEIESLQVGGKKKGKGKGDDNARLDECQVSAKLNFSLSIVSDPLAFLFGSADPCHRFTGLKIQVISY
jgi:hypothetical protein